MPRNKPYAAAMEAMANILRIGAEEFDVSLPLPESVGVEFESDWPTSRRQMLRMARRNVRDTGLEEIRFGDQDNRRRSDQKKYSLEDLRQCVVDGLPREQAQ